MVRMLHLVEVIGDDKLQAVEGMVTHNDYFTYTKLAEKPVIVRCLHDAIKVVGTHLSEELFRHRVIKGTVSYKASFYDNVLQYTSNGFMLFNFINIFSKIYKDVSFIYVTYVCNEELEVNNVLINHIKDGESMYRMSMSGNFIEAMRRLCKLEKECI